MEYWFTFTIPFHAEEAHVQLPPQKAFQRFWQNVLLQNPECCLFAGIPGPWGLHFYVAVPYEELMKDYLKPLRATEWLGVPGEEEQVRLILGPEQKAKVLWDLRLEHNSEHPEALMMYRD